MIDALTRFLRLHWTSVTWGLYEWFSSARLVTATLVIFIVVVALFVRQPRYRRRLLTMGMAMLATYWLIISPLFSVPATYGLTRFVPQDTGQPADAIVVLARPLEARGDRYDVAVQMMAAGRADQILVMTRHPAKQVLQDLQQRNLSPHGLTSAICIRTTQHEAESAASILGAQGIRRIILITDQPHMLRAWLTFQGYGFSVIPHMVAIPDWVAHQERSLLAIREYLGLMSYGLMGRLQTPAPDQLETIWAEAAAHFPPEYCFLTVDQLRELASSSF